MVFAVAEVVLGLASVVWSAVTTAPVSSVVNVAHVASICALPLTFGVVATTSKNKTNPLLSVGRGRYYSGYTPEQLEAAVGEFVASSKQKEKPGATTKAKKLGTIRNEWLRDKGVNIPYQTLKDAVQRALANKQVTLQRGRPTWFSQEDEAEILKHIDAMEDVALSPDKHYIMWLAGCLAKVYLKAFKNKKGADQAMPTTGWWRRFKRRHPAYGLRATQTYERNRATAADAWAIHRFFDTYEECLDMEQSPGYKYRQRADRVGNLDESGFQSTVRPTKSFVKKGRRNGGKRLSSNDNRDTETLVSTSLANGGRPPPHVSFPGPRDKMESLGARAGGHRSTIHGRQCIPESRKLA